MTVCFPFCYARDDIGGSIAGIVGLTPFALAAEGLLVSQPRLTGVSLFFYYVHMFASGVSPKILH